MATLCTRHADTVRMGGLHAYFNSLLQPDEQYRPTEHIHVEHHRTGHLPATLKDIAPYLIISVAVMTFTYWVAGYVKNIYLSLLVKVALAASLYIFLMWSLKSIVFRESLQYLFKKKTIQ